LTATPFTSHAPGTPCRLSALNDGLLVNAVYGFTSIFAEIIKEFESRPIWPAPLI
jgi:hypothetical protein